MIPAAPGDALEARSRAAILRACRAYRAAVAALDPAPVAALLAEGDAAGAVSSVVAAAAPHALDVAGAWAETVLAHARAAAAAASVPGPVAKRLPFTGFAGATARALAGLAAQLATGILGSLRRTLLALLARAGDASPEQLAELMIRAAAIAPADATAAMVHRARLTGGDKAALRAALATDLRDARYDAAVRAAIAGTPIPAAKVERMVASYLHARAESRLATFARTEAQRARWTGVQAMWEQQAELGMVDATRVTKVWVHKHDNRVRDTHLSIPRLQPDGVPLAQAFVTSAGNRLMHPGDPGAPIEEIINCRCRLDYVTA
jgi:hypothetical protein